MFITCRVGVFTVALFLMLALQCQDQVNGLGSFKSKTGRKRMLGRGIFNRKTVEESKAEYTGPLPFTFTTRLNHFNESEGGVDNNFQIRYIINEEHNTDRKGPILFYAGNEGNIEAFYDNSGFLTTTLAQRLNATVIFGEHRYYGESFPFGNKTIAFERQNLKYLSVEQVMMDYVNLLSYIKKEGGYDQNTEYENPRTPIYVFGGSYGGMLATWLRMKYPTHFHGAIASSAPILWFKGAVDPNAYSRIASEVLKKIYGDDCYNWQHQAFYDLIQASKLDITYKNLTMYFDMCPDSNLTTENDVQMLIEYITDALGTMAMVNYPYSTSFITPLPAWPVNESCNLASEFLLKEEPEPGRQNTTYNFRLIKSLARMMEVWQGGKCLNLSGSEGGALDGNGWEVQTCFEFPMPQGDDPAQSAYTWTNWDEDEFTLACQDKYGLTPMYDWALDHFGGRQPRRDFLYHTNIVWVNGEFDPWHGGGINHNITSGTTAIFVKEAAHHYDLRLPNDNDTVQIREAREIEYMHLSQWISNWRLNVI